MKIVREFIKELKIGRYLISKNLLNEMELRSAFILQVLGMMFNNIVFVVIWIFFFKAFGAINGWDTPEVLALQGYITLTYGICFGFGGGVRYLPTKVHNGSFDIFLLSPRSLYMRIFTSHVETSAIGDLIFGFILLSTYVFVGHLSLIQVVLLILCVVPAVLVFMNIALITSLVAFLFPDTDNLSKNIFESFIAPSMYPGGLYQGTMRFIFLFGVPALAVGGLPVDIVKNRSILWLVILWLIAFAWAILASYLLKKAVRKYESGNLIGSRE